jgi:hypothetical protein
MKVKLVSPNGDPHQTNIQAEDETLLGLIQEVTWKITAQGKAQVTIKRAYLPPAGDVSACPSGEVLHDEITTDALGTLIEFELPEEQIRKWGRVRKSLSEE